jgi:hypothetical protein
MGVSGNDIGALVRKARMSPDWGQPSRECRLANQTQLHHTAAFRRELPVMALIENPQVCSLKFPTRGPWLL